MILQRISKLKRNDLKPFQRITLLQEEDGMTLLNNPLTIHCSDVPENFREDEYIQIIQTKKSKYVLDIYYKTNSYIVYQPWDFVKQRSKELNYLTLHEILSDSLINTCLSSNLLIKKPFDYYINLIDTIEYYSRTLNSNILLRIDDYFGNKFFKLTKNNE